MKNYIIYMEKVFGFDRTWWGLFQQRVVSTKLDLYVFITITGSIPLLVDY